MKMKFENCVRDYDWRKKKFKNVGNSRYVIWVIKNASDESFINYGRRHLILIFVINDHGENVRPI